MKNYPFYILFGKSVSFFDNFHCIDISCLLFFDKMDFSKMTTSNHFSQFKITNIYSEFPEFGNNWLI